MTKSSKFALGTRSGEIISVPIEIISVRLKDGSILGPKLYTGTDEKKHIEEGYSPLDYNQPELDIILTQGWNRRRGSLLQNIDNLKASIKSAGRVLDPLDLILDGPYVVCAEGHRRHICSRWLQLEEFPILVVPAMVYTAGYGTQGNYENFEYQMWYRNQKEPLSILEKYDFIQEKLASGLTKEDFCEKVGIGTAEYDTIMLVAGQSSEVRSLIEQELISPTTIKIARATADRKEWTQQQFETFIQDSVKLAEQVGKKRVTGSLVQTLISEYQPPASHQVQIELKASLESTAQTTTKDTQIKEVKSTNPPKLKVKPLAKELEEVFIELMFDSQGGIEDDGVVTVNFTKEVWEKAMGYFDKIPDSLIEKLHTKLRLSTKK
jgi:hypothetical protein